MKINCTNLPLISGGLMIICLSNRPGRRRAGSKISGRFVPAKTTTLVVVLNPVDYKLINVSKKVIN